MIHSVCASRLANVYTVITIYFILFCNRALIRQVRDNIISAVPNVDMTSQSFYHLIQPYLVDHTEQFIHEFIAFARSPYDVRAYDR